MDEKFIRLVELHERYLAAVRSKDPELNDFNIAYCRKSLSLGFFVSSTGKNRKLYPHSRDSIHRIQNRLDIALGNKTRGKAFHFVKGKGRKKIVLKSGKGKSYGFEPPNRGRVIHPRSTGYRR